jgi:hypothetical protein
MGCRLSPPKRRTQRKRDAFARDHAQRIDVHYGGAATERAVSIARQTDFDTPGDIARYQRRRDVLGHTVAAIALQLTPLA